MDYDFCKWVIERNNNLTDVSLGSFKGVSNSYNLECSTSSWYNAELKIEVDGVLISTGVGQGDNLSFDVLPGSKIAIEFTKQGYGLDYGPGVKWYLKQGGNTKVSCTYNCIFKSVGFKKTVYTDTHTGSPSGCLKTGNNYFLNIDDGYCKNWADETGAANIAGNKTACAAHCLEKQPSSNTSFYMQLVDPFTCGCWKGDSGLTDTKCELQLNDEWRSYEVVGPNDYKIIDTTSWPCGTSTNTECYCGQPFSGCTDPAAANYDKYAYNDDGSCQCKSGFVTDSNNLCTPMTCDELREEFNTETCCGSDSGVCSGLQTAYDANCATC